MVGWQADGLLIFGSSAMPTSILKIVRLIALPLTDPLQIGDTALELLSEHAQFMNFLPKSVGPLDNIVDEGQGGGDYSQHSEDAPISFSETEVGIGDDAERQQRLQREAHERNGEAEPCGLVP